MEKHNYCRNVVSPIESINYLDEKTMPKENMIPEYNVSYANGDIWTSCHNKLYYDREKAILDVQKQGVFYQQKLDYENQLKALRINYHNYLKLLGWTVYCDCEGYITVAITDPTGKLLAARRLLNVAEYRTRILSAYYPKMQSILEITWKGENKNSIAFSLNDYGISTKIFLKQLKSHGIMLLVSGRSESQAADALLAYSFKEASAEEIPGIHGWVKKSDGSWHFADETEITMQEVMKYACAK